MKNIILSLLCLITLNACGNNEKSENKKITIGFSTWTVNDPWAVFVYNTVFEATNRYPNLEIILTDGKNDSLTQISQVESLITRGVDALIIFPTDHATFGNTAKLAKDNDLPVVAINRLPLNKDHQYMDVFIGIQQEKAGEMQVQRFIETLEREGRMNEEMEVAILMGMLGGSDTMGRTDGVKSALASYPNLKIAYEGTANWQRDEALRIVENWLQADRNKKNLKVIFSNNDEMAVGAIFAIQAEERNDIKIYGIDGVARSAVELIGKGLDMTVIQDPIAYGNLTIDAAYNLAIGKPVENLDGKFAWVPLSVIDSDNREQYLKQFDERDDKK